MQRFLRYASYLSLALFATAGMALALQVTDIAWWLVRTPGLAALVLAAAAVAFPPPPRKLVWHRPLGWLAAAALGAHVVLAAGLEPNLWRWLSPAIPVEIVFGLVAAGALVIALGARQPRTLRLSRGSPTGLGLHRIAGTVACVAAAAHIAFIAGAEIAVALLMSSAIITLLAVTFQNARHISSIAVALALIAGAAAMLAIPPLSEVRLGSLRISPIDHARFSHSDHGGIACTTCHHNFVDRSGGENCITCHKQLTTTEAMRVDRLFHAFCGDCHRTEKFAGRKTGPIDHCKGCHEN
jgi:Class III cytochrome C family